MRAIFRCIVCFGSLLIGSCDTSDTLSKPDESYFLKYLGNEGDQQGVDFVVNPDNSIVVLGTSKAAASAFKKIYVAKLDGRGKLIWEKTMGESLNDEAVDLELVNNANNDLILVANSEVTSGNNDVLIIKLDQNGAELGRVRQGLTATPGSAPKNDLAKSITKIDDGGFIVAGSTSFIPQDPTDKSDFMYMRFDANLVWASDASGWKNSAGFVSGFTGEDVAIKVIQHNPTTFYAFGYSDFDNVTTTGDFNFIIFGLGPLGDPSSQLVFAGLDNADEKMTGFSDARSQSVPGFVLTGTSQNAIDGDVYIAKLPKDLTFFQSDLIVNRQVGLNIGKAALQRAVNAATASNFYFVASDKVNGTSLDISLAKLDNRGNKIFEVDFGSKDGDDVAGYVTELPDGRILLIGTMTLGGAVDGQKKIALFKLNAQGKLAP
jgi:hypothetical protein